MALYQTKRLSHSAYIYIYIYIESPWCNHSIERRTDQPPFTQRVYPCAYSIDVYSTMRTACVLLYRAYYLTDFIICTIQIPSPIYKCKGAPPLSNEDSFRCSLEYALLYSHQYLPDRWLVSKRVEGCTSTRRPAIGSARCSRRPDQQRLCRRIRTIVCSRLCRPC